MRRRSPDPGRERRSAPAERVDGRNAGRRSADRTRPAEALQRAIGNRGVQALHERGELPGRLAVGRADGAAEREAERVADAVLRAPEPGSFPGSAEATGAGVDRSVEGSDRATGIDRPGESAEVPRSSGAAAERTPSGEGDPSGTVSGDVESSVESVGSGGRPLPGDVRSFFEPRFGREFGDVRVHTGSRADEAARSVDALAFTYGRDVAFRSGTYRPRSRSGRRLLAHELTHVVQQSADGRRVQRYVAYDSSQQQAGNSLGWEHPGSADLRVSDDGRMAVEDNGWGAGTNKRAWTTRAELSESNAELDAAGSNTRLAETSGSISGKPPEDSSGDTQTLVEIEPEKASGSGTFTLASDCGAACRQVMGSGRGEDVAVYRRGETEAYTDPEPYTGGDNSPGGSTNTPERFFEDILRDAFGSNLGRSELYRRYDSLSSAQQERFDARYGINEHARPEVGQGQTISTGYDMPGYRPLSRRTWNFHYAATVLRSGDDQVALESAAGWGPGDWIFYMYGFEKPGQTFHEEHAATRTHGSEQQTMVVQPADRLEGRTNAAGVHLVRVPRRWRTTRIAKLPRGTRVRTTRRGTNWRKVEVLDGPHRGEIGWMMNTFFEP